MWMLAGHKRPAIVSAQTAKNRNTRPGWHFGLATTLGNVIAGKD